jgi:hypothetical protein
MSQLSTLLDKLIHFVFNPSLGAPAGKDLGSGWKVTAVDKLAEGFSLDTQFC